MSETKKSGLVLGGGGARGCYEVGCWQAFDALGIQFDVVAGTSIGAIVAAIYTQQSLESIVQFVTHMGPEDIVTDMIPIPENWEELTRNRKELEAFFKRYLKEGTDITPLKESFDKMFDYETFKSSPINFACMTFDVSRMEPVAWFKHELTEQNAADVILASASCFPAFPMMDIDGQKYVDGGYADNVPVDLAVAMGASDITVIDVHGPGRTHPIPASCTYLEPVAKLGNFLDFRQDNALRCMRLGYLETMKRHNRFAGYLYTFVKSSWPRMFMVSQYLDMKLKEYGIVPSMEEARNIMHTYLGELPPAMHTRYTQDYAGGAFIEALACAAGLPDAMLYGYDKFLESLYRQLKSIRSIEPPRNFRQSLELLQQSGRDEVINFLHSALVHNGGRLPLTLSPLKNMFSHEYILAVVWYCLYSYLALNK